MRNGVRGVERLLLYAQQLPFSSPVASASSSHRPQAPATTYTSATMRQTLLATSLLVGLMFLAPSMGTASQLQHGRVHHKLADGCRHVYVDMGTNVGHQIRKLYQPELYRQPSATDALFTRYFGKNRPGVCVFGFEPNPTHAPRLKRLETAMNSEGWRVKIFTGVAVGIKEENVTFIKDHRWPIDLSARIVKPEAVRHEESIIMTTMDIAAFFHKEIIGRYIPDNDGLSLPPAIIMKSDIERQDMKNTLFSP
eukprot:gene3237-13260_t